MKRKILRWGVVGALVASVTCACLLRCFNWEHAEATIVFVEICELIGKLFMNGLKMLVVPLITSSIICGVMRFGSKSEFHRLGLKTFLFYFLSCFVAVTVGLIVVNALRPGDTDAALASKILGQANRLPEHFACIEGTSGYKVSEFLLRLLPPNILAAATDNAQIL